MAASSDPIDIHTAVMFQSLHSDHGYLPIQDSSLRGATATVDAATMENMHALITVGERKLAQQSVQGQRRDGEVRGMTYGVAICLILIPETAAERVGGSHTSCRQYGVTGSEKKFGTVRRGRG
jgi:hypothetical protein